ncbi:hypothetical protein RF55_12708 [Lasius niger]|uniref:Uncharacterized protein n=1 Tax=Lasius niger TaxID=67767 RepID=A0A0J7KCF0_LASNI|nr:hypothetical protein RF55_12708 [Lasius niger]
MENIPIKRSKVTNFHEIDFDDDSLEMKPSSAKQVKYFETKSVDDLDFGNADWSDMMNEDNSEYNMEQITPKLKNFKKGNGGSEGKIINRDLNDVENYELRPQEPTDSEVRQILMTHANNMKIRQKEKRLNTMKQNYTLASNKGMHQTCWSLLRGIQIEKIARNARIKSQSNREDAKEKIKLMFQNLARIESYDKKYKRNLYLRSKEVGDEFYKENHDEEIDKPKISFYYNKYHFTTI